MAFGKPPDVTGRVKNAVREDKLWKAHIISEETSKTSWKSKWSWIQDEYRQMREKLNKVSKNSDFLKDVNDKVREEDKRTIKPIPDTVNHEYGWTSNLPDFKLDKYGPDVDRSPPLPPEFLITK